MQVERVTKGKKKTQEAELSSRTIMSSSKFDHVRKHHEKRYVDKFPVHLIQLETPLLDT